MYKCKNGYFRDCSECPFFIESCEYCTLDNEYIEPVVDIDKELEINGFNPYSSLKKAKVFKET